MDSRIGEQLDVFALVGPLEVPDIREQLKQIYLHDSELANFVKGTFAVLLENQRRTEQTALWFEKPEGGLTA